VGQAFAGQRGGESAGDDLAQGVEQGVADRLSPGIGEEGVLPVGIGEDVVELVLQTITGLISDFAPALDLPWASLPNPNTCATIISPAAIAFAAKAPPTGSLQSRAPFVLHFCTTPAFPSPIGKMDNCV